MTPQQKSELRWFFPETALYAILVAAYCLAVFRCLGPVLRHLAHSQRVAYAVVALALMVVQGFVLERVAHALIGIVHRDKKAGS